MTSHYGSLRVTYRHTDSTGIELYAMSTPDNGPGTEYLRVLPPTKPTPGMAHKLLFVLPVQAGLATTYGDGLKTLQALDAEDKYNLTIIEPTFGIDPWYADDPTNPAHRYETFMAKQLAPWAKRNLAKSRSAQTWLIGFSKSGLGGQDLILKHPKVFTLDASWDFPADMNTYTQYQAGEYGTQVNFKTHYELTKAFLAVHEQPFEHSNRIWIGGYYVFPADIKHYDVRLTQAGITHTNGPTAVVPHRWDTGWVPTALAALEADSELLRGGS